ncbi:hypothetical protein GCM10025877_24920 [Agromyces mangrovi Wang et al. 2018]|nr:hypothetical protein GCM10025877_24920 [Agromyces mangrovi]
MPASLVVIAILALAVLVLPLVALVVRAPWADLPALVTSAPVLEALRLSLVTATIATVACLALGIPLAMLLAHSADAPAPLRRLLRAAVTVPLLLPRSSAASPCCCSSVAADSSAGGSQRRGASPSRSRPAP